jgi:hypothetical protein
MNPVKIRIGGAKVSLIEALLPAPESIIRQTQFVR